MWSFQELTSFLPLRWQKNMCRVVLVCDCASQPPLPEGSLHSYPSCSFFKGMPSPESSFPSKISCRIVLTCSRFLLFLQCSLYSCVSRIFRRVIRMEPVCICLPSLRTSEWRVSLTLSASDDSIGTDKDFPDGFRGAEFSLFFVPRNVNTSKQTACCKGGPLKTVTKAKPLAIRTHSEITEVNNPENPVDSSSSDMSIEWLWCLVVESRLEIPDTSERRERSSRTAAMERVQSPF